MFEKIIKDIKKYLNYSIYAAKAELKSEVQNSYLGYIWWVLDPLLFMFVYMFVALVVFSKSEQYFPIFVFIGLSLWQFVDKTLKQSVKLVSSNKSIVSKVYIPKFILVLTRIYINGFKMVVSFSLIAVMLIIFKVHISLNILYFIPLLILATIFTFGSSCILLHFGVYLEDLANLINIALRLVFYLTGIFFSIEKRVPHPWNVILLKFNPIAFIINSSRNCILYSTGIEVSVLLIWLVLSVFISLIGVSLIYKYENDYVKVI